MSRTQRSNFLIQMLTIHPATIDDFAVIESLNNSVVNLTSPMDAERIQQLHAMSSYHRVIVQDASLWPFCLCWVLIVTTTV